jgi:DNA polymerase
MPNNSTIRFLHDIRRLLRYHQSLGITSYPATPELDAFLHPRPKFLDPSPAQMDKTLYPKKEDRVILSNSPNTPQISEDFENVDVSDRGSKRQGKDKPAQPQGPTTTVSLADIREELQGCTRCGLCKSRTNIVFGQGCEQPNLLIVAEWPGNEDDQQVEALCGEAGELLTRMLAAIKLKRKDVFLTHTVKCLPPGNRAPEPDEINACLTFLHRQIEVLKPRIICTMGPLAARALLKTNDSFFLLRGRFHEFQTIQGETLPLLPTFHPAFLIKNPEMKKASWQDLQMLQKKLNITNSKKVNYSRR